MAPRRTGSAAMTLKQSRELPLGLYVIYWKEGGSSLAAIGMGENGDRWLAPTNWVGPLPAKASRMIWRKIQNVQRIEVQERISDERDSTRKFPQH